MESFSESTVLLENPGTVHSEPIITVYGSGEITLMVGQFIVELADFEGSITINSELQEAYSRITSMNSSMSGGFPLLVPGNNAISWTGDVTRIEIEPNWRYLQHRIDRGIAICYTELTKSGFVAENTSKSSIRRSLDKEPESREEK